MGEHDVERVARALARKAKASEMGDAGFIAQHVDDYVTVCWRDHIDRAETAIAAMGDGRPSISPELIDKLKALATRLTAQGAYEACDLIDTVVERLTPPPRAKP
jgi:hypothetical protein